MSSRTPSPANLLDTLAEAIGECGAEDELTISAAQRPGPGADLTAIVRHRGWEATRPGRAAIDALTAHPDVETVTRRGGRLLVRLTASRLTALGAALEEGSPDALPTDDLAAGEDWLIDFCNPNATKALHVGHLRDIALGHALAGVGEAAGARVVRQSQVGDCGRSMGEAMAGYLRFANGSTPASAGCKSDRFVGECYARYVASLGRDTEPGDAATDHALAREGQERSDLAEDLLGRWSDRDSEVRSLSQRLRTWAVEGQDATLARLGVSIDRTLLESDFVAQMAATTAAALERGVACYAENGSIVYETGREEYPELLLHRRDGFPTQHLRYLALWHALGPSLEGVRTIAIGGDEWEAMLTYGEEILRGICPDEHVHPKTTVLHGMVTIGDDVVKSSLGDGLLLDDLLDGLASSEDVRAALPAHDRVAAEQLAAITALGFCLGRPMSKRLTIDARQLLDSRANAGWALAQAWARAWDPRYDGAPDPATDDDRYRFLLVQSQLHRQLLEIARHRLDVLSLTRLHAHLSRWFLEAPPTPRLARAMRGVLGSGLRALGLIGVNARLERREVVRLV